MSVSQYHGVRVRADFTEEAPRAEDLSNYKVCRKGEIVVNRMSAYQGALGVSPVDGLVSPDYMVLRLRATHDARFWEYLMRSGSFVSEMSARVRGVGTVDAKNVRTPRISFDELKLIDVPTLSFTHERAIADFLDRETAKIDALIEKQNEMIGLLCERKTEAVRHAISGRVTGGPSSKRTPDWLGTMPTHWERKPLWSMYRREKRTGYIDEPMVSVFREYGVVFKEAFHNLNVTAEDRSIYQLVEPGWLVVNRMKAWQGSVGVSDIRGISSGHYICFRPLHRENHAFLNWLFRSPQYRDGLAMQSRGVRPGQAEVDNALLRQMPVMLPLLHEQDRIVRFLNRETAKIDALIAQAEEFIALAKERRAALITAAVTGQIDVLGKAG